MTNEDRKLMFDMIRRCRQAILIVTYDRGFEGICEFDQDLANAIVNMLRVHPGLLDNLKSCINIIEKERILN